MKTITEDHLCFICREVLEEDRNKLTQQNQSLMSDLDCSREQVAVKNKENLKV